MSDEKRFIDSYTLEERKQQSQKQLDKYPNMVPVIVEKYEKSKLSPVNCKKRYLVSHNTLFLEFSQNIKSKLNFASPQHSIYFYIAKQIPSKNNTMKELYQKFKHEDGFLYVEYGEQESFGRISSEDEINQLQIKNE
ncbi:hypothetical protein PPERSA_12278 [Pseudocohnilembus persalinus]|uniref:Autophagy-related protein n=1 Tax=Pseudocohnilembus persalinus TaxID=266149 RepID=A0A0V0R4X3_PSEPJ|nr:hypothetical protein PPERSA_12278 [Pseudocohnilembus persalinus]|eukprot:KRX09535.1 hypothetical protein PPERSA_12278 [Pseudocohnilembus persalinus]